MKAIKREDLKTMNETEHDDFVLINVLDRDAFNKRHIRTSVNVPVGDDDFEQIVERIVGDKQRKVVVYCANSECDASPRAARKLDDAGFTSVFDYAGGSEDWFAQKQAA